MAHARSGEFPPARAAIADALAVAPSGGHKVKEADVHIFVGAAYYDMGELEKGLEHARIGAEMAEAENAMECACAGFYGMGLTNLERSELAEAAGNLNRSLQFAEDSGWYGFVNRIRGSLAAVASDEDRALPEMEEAIASARNEGDRFTAAIVSERLARVHLRRGEPALADEALAPALAYYEESGTRAYEARGLELSARINEALGRPDRGAEARAAAAELRATFEDGPEAGADGVPGSASDGDHPDRTEGRDTAPLRAAV
jgi:tetratricopeptide (TPR) repeat protein